MLRWTSSRVVTPPYVAGPFRLDPFRALMLSPTGSATPPRRARSRVPTETWRSASGAGRSRATCTATRNPRSTCTSTPPAAMTVRGLVGALNLSLRANHPDERVVYPHEGIHPVQAAELADRMTEMGMNPAPILLVHRGPAAVRELLRSVLCPRPRPGVRRPQRRPSPDLGDPRTGDRADLDRLLAGSRALLADGHHRYAAYLRMQQASPGTAADLGLAMLVDQDDTPLFLGAIHRILVGTTLEALHKAATSFGGLHRPRLGRRGGRPRPRDAGRHRRARMGDVGPRPPRRDGRGGGAPRLGASGTGKAARPRGTPPLGR